MPRHIIWSCLTVSLFTIPAAALFPLTATSAQPAAAPAAGSTVGREPLVTINSDRSSLTIVERFSKVVEFGNRISRVDGFDPEVIQVTALSPTRLRVQALAPGVTTMVVTDADDHIYSVEIFITGDVRHLQAYIDRFFPKAAVQAVAVRDSVVLRGWVTKPEHITELVEIAEQFYTRVLNQMKVGGVQQVLLKVKVIEAQRTKIRQLGMNWAFRNQNAFVASAPGMLTPVSGFTSAFGVAPTVTIEPTSLRDPTVSFSIVGTDEAFNGFIEALKQESLLKILAEPELISMNGRPATLLAGGEFPILVPQSLGTVTIEWREFGTRLEMVPIILGNDTLRLELQPEVSDRDFSNAVTVQGTVVPGLTTRRANTQVEMRFGQTLMVAGLLSTRKTAVLDKIPIFGELPWIGAAFRRERFDETETELVIMVTPELVAPLARHEVPPGGPGLSSETPTDREFMLYGWPEVPNYSDGCYGCDTPYYGDVYPEHMEPVPAESSDGMPFQPNDLDGGGTVIPPAVIPPRNGAVISPSVPAVPSSRSRKPGLVLPKTEAPASGPSVSAPSAGVSESNDLTANRKSPDWWSGARTRPTARQKLYQPAGFSNDSRAPATGTRPGDEHLWQPTIDQAGAKRTGDRKRGSGRSRLIEPRPGMIQPVSGQN